MHFKLIREQIKEEEEKNNKLTKKRKKHQNAQNKKINKKDQNVRQPPSSCGKATERVFWIGRRPFNLTMMKVKVVVGIGLLKVFNQPIMKVKVV